MAAGAAATDPMLPAVARVVGRRRETADVWTLEVAPPDGWAGFAPGQFNMLYLPGLGEVPISMSGDPAAPGPIRHTVRAVGAVSAALAALRPGAAVGLRGPYGSAWPVAEAAGADVVVMAGGLGLAPLRPALYRLRAERARYGRVALLYGTRSPADILFRRELERWRRQLDLEIEVTVDRAAGDWRGSVGVVTRLLPRIAFEPVSSVALVCGPEVMMRFAADALLDAGVPEPRIHLSMERNMRCAIGQCGHCQFGADFVCKDGPVMSYDRLRARLKIREL
ncbi:FAD/NAD(P)-binding protein [Tistlia consotensis]|nr:FAD/NAD(P)-binding protein [Tistlia consotensis]